jgi:cell division GTPase FtsZ
VRIAVVGLGVAGQTIAQTFAEKYSKIADVYVICDERFSSVEFFKFDEFKRLAEILLTYDHVILTAGLGGRGGDCLVKMVEKLNNVSWITVCRPFWVEKYRVKAAEEQLKKLRGNVTVKELDDLIKRMPDAPINDALMTFDCEMAEEIAEFIKELM